MFKIILASVLILSVFESVSVQTPRIEETYPRDVYLVPVEDANSLQQMIDQHGSVRLEIGNYRSSQPITIRSNQKIYGLGFSFSENSGTLLPEVTVEPGTSGALISNVNLREGLNFPESNLVTRKNFFFEISGTVSINGATLEENTFLGLENGNISIETTSNGWMRNNRFIRIRAQNLNPLLTIKGDQALNSYGNVFVWGNQLTQPNNMVSVSNQRDITFVGWDDEAYATSTVDPIYKFKDIDVLKLWTMGGASPTDQPLFDIDVSEAQLTNLTMGGSTQTPILLGQSVERAFTFNSREVTNLNPTNTWLNGIRSVNNNSGSSFEDQGMLVFEELPSTTADEFSSMYKAYHGVPWERPSFEPIPDPTGPDWSIDLDSQQDASNELQALINNNNLVLLEPRIYYISKPLRIRAGTKLIGSGANKTAIVAKSPDMDMIIYDQIDQSRSRPRIQISDITFQGGANGIHLFATPGEEGGQYSEFLFSNLVFRNFTVSGFQINQIFGLDNGLFYAVNFVDSASGFKQTVDPNALPGGPNSSYVDKVVFFKNQFIRNDIGIDLTASRANNLNSIINSRFEDNINGSIIGRNNNDLQLLNSILINNGGSPTINNVADVIRCYFRADQRGISFLSSGRVEGTRFELGKSSDAKIFEQSDDPFFVPNNMAWANFSYNFLVNSSADNIDVGNVEFGIFINNQLLSRPDLSIPAAQVWLETVIPLANGEVNPRPSLFIGTNEDVIFQNGFGAGND